MARKAQQERRVKEPKEPKEDPFTTDEADDIVDEDGPPAIDPYAVLGLETDATTDHVKKAYRKLALKHHPGTLSRVSCQSC